MKWIDIEKEKPPAGIIWLLIKGRMESDHIRDTQIIPMISNPLPSDKNQIEFRSLDYAQAIYYGSKNFILAEWETPIAWMPYDKMPLPAWIQKKLSM